MTKRNAIIVVTIMAFLIALTAKHAFFPSRRVVIPVPKHDWVVGDKFGENGAFHGTRTGVSPRLLHAENFVLWGSFMGSDANTGRLTSASFTAKPGLSVMVCGYPNRDGIKVYAENVATGEKAVQTFNRDPEQTWLEFPLEFPDEWGEVSTRLTAVDSCRSWGGWLGISSPYEDRIVGTAFPGSLLNRNTLIPTLVALTFLISLLNASWFERIWRSSSASTSIVIAAVLIGYGLFIDSSSLFLSLIAIAAEIVTLTLLIFAPGHILLGWLARNTSPTARLSASPAASAVIWGTLFILIQALDAPVWAAALLVIGVAIISLLIVWKRIKSVSFRTIPAATPHGLTLTLIWAMAAACHVSVDANPPNERVASWENVANRSIPALPPENQIHRQTTMTLASGDAPWVWPAKHEWTMGDRSPLMPVLQATAALATFHPKSYEFWDFTLLGIVLNSLFIFPLCLLSHRLFRSSRTAKLAPVLIVMNTFVFTNLFFTWPKLFAAYFALAAVVWILELGLSSKTTPVATGVLIGLSTLAENTAVLSVPAMFLVFTFHKVRRDGWWRWLKASLIILCAMVGTASPWLAYKWAHPEIDTLKIVHDHYLPIDAKTLPGDRFHTKDIPAAIATFIRQTPPRRQIVHRSRNAKAFVDPSILRRQTSNIILGEANQYFNNLSEHTFRKFTVFVGIVPLLAALITICVLFRPAVRRSAINLRPLTTLAAYCAITLAINVSLKWSPISNHDLPAFDALTTLILAYGVASVTPFGAIVMTTFSCFHFANFILSTTLGEGLPPFDLFNIVLVVCVLVSLFGAFQRKSIERHSLSFSRT